MQEYKMYGGSVVLTFDPDKHIYRVNGEVVYGVTSICGVLDKPALMYWAVNKALEYVDDNMPVGMVLDEVNKSRILKEAKTAHRRISSEAADIGTIVHDWLETWVNSKINKMPEPSLPINAEVRRGVETALAWFSKRDVEFISSERKLFSRLFSYAGTLDVECIVDGKRTVIDFKTSSGIYPEYFIQTSAYCIALTEETGERYENMIILRVPKSEKEFAYAESKDVEMYFDCFVGCLTNYRRIMAEKDEKYKETKIKLEAK